MKLLLILLQLSVASNITSATTCSNYGPQSPRDIRLEKGHNQIIFQTAPKFKNLNLCNVHFHKGAEHRGPEFSLNNGKGKYGGFKCNDSDQRSKIEGLQKPNSSSCTNVSPGDTVEVHWVYSSCKVSPGEGLTSCLSKECANPQLRVETQVFLLTNNKNALDFKKFSYQTKKGKYHQTKSLPNSKGIIQYLGSTTGPKYSEKKCSPFQVTWSVRPTCKKLYINTLHSWCEKNLFSEDHAHGVRDLVTDLQLLAPID